MRYLAFFSIILFLAACSNNNTAEEQATEPGIQILVDESFAPIIDDQYQVFKSSYPNLKVELFYKSENAVIHNLLEGDIGIAILSRKLLPQEIKLFEKREISVKANKVATDAVAFITHKSSADSSITVDEVTGIMRGAASAKNLIFDNANSSTVRYLKDLAEIKDLPKKGVYALQSNDDVIKYVHNNPGTIGVIGINWMKQPTKELDPVVKQLKVLSVKNSKGLPGSDKFYKPSQNNLALGLYPLSRDIFFIDCQGGRAGSSFEAFVAGERGQRIILKSGLMPNKIPSREILIRETRKP